ncbi:MAG: PIN domain-containing protein [Rhodothermales bacterium]
MPEVPRRICFDTNVVLDVLLDRAPFAQPAARLIDAVAQGDVEGLLGATTLTTVDYILRRHRDRAVARQGLLWLLALFDVAPVARPALEAALVLDWPDFEDAVLHEAARLARAEALVTRNAADFGAATLAVYTPDELLAILKRDPA